MSLATSWLSLCCTLALVGCGGDPPKTGDPQTAKEKQRQEASKDPPAAPTGKRSGWRYGGDRDECFFLVGKRCYKSEAKACAAAKCGSRTCEIEGGGPATVRCAK